jgi:ariadne-1
LGPWKEHGTQWYKCNRYVESESCEARSRQDQSRELLRRYLHYFQRYTNHENSLKKEETLQKSVGDLMLAMQHQQMSWIEVQCIQKAVEILIKCRKTLTFTYVFAYYLISSNQTIIFEDNQRDLEVATEELSFLLEKEHCLEGEDGPPYTAYYSDFKKNVLDKSNLCNRRCDILLGHVQEGYDQNYWNFSSQDNIYPTKIN